MTAVLFIAAALFATGLLAAAWRRDLAGALAGLPAMGAGAAIAAAGASRFAPSNQTPASGQELAVLVAVATLALVVVGSALAAPAGHRSVPPRAGQAPPPQRRRPRR